MVRTKEFQDTFLFIFLSVFFIFFIKRTNIALVVEIKYGSRHPANHVGRYRSQE